MDMEGTGTFGGCHGDEKRQRTSTGNFRNVSGCDTSWLLGHGASTAFLGSSMTVNATTSLATPSPKLLFTHLPHGGSHPHAFPEPHLACLWLGQRRYCSEEGGSSTGERFMDIAGKTVLNGPQLSEARKDVAVVGLHPLASSIDPTGAAHRCQVDGCEAALADAKDYHRRHRVCEKHSKAPKVLVSRVEQRFCQQCSRFHVVSEFDGAKRSCRRRLAGHNQRRRKSPTNLESQGKKEGRVAAWVTRTTGSAPSPLSCAPAPPSDRWCGSSATLSELVRGSHVATGLAWSPRWMGSSPPEGGWTQWCGDVPRGRFTLRETSNVEEEGERFVWRSYDS